MANQEISTHHFTKFAPKERKQFVPKSPGQFAGWISRSWNVAWVVSPERKDKRSGSVQPLTDKAPKQNNYVLHYEIKEPGRRHRQARFHKIEAPNQEEAVRQAQTFMHSIGLDSGGRSRSTLYCNEMEIKLKGAQLSRAIVG
ncbi:hypothetical protein [Paenibacillus sp. HJGM_3]|uniref:hypothetical protein n=1 Tax=Paenibacillus sp. HJGM_3 TaxID=3379816 RepID=UPI00385954E7